MITELPGPSAGLSLGPRSRRLFIAMLWITGLGGALAVVANELLHVNGMRTGLALAIASVSILAGLSLRAGNERLALLCLCWGMSLTVMFSSIAFLGVRALVLGALPLFVVITAWLLGPRQGRALAVLSAVVIIGLALGQQAGWGGYDPMPRPPMFHGFILFMLLAMAATFGIATSDEIRAENAHNRALSASLQTLNTELEQRVAARTAELHEAVDHLRRAQEELVNTEKLASLGAMVAGISHELNTPIGNARTVASTLAERTVAFGKLVEQGPLRRSELDNFIESSRGMADLIDRSVQRAANLVASFKQVAVDQTSEQRRPFLLVETVNDVLATMQPAFKRADCTVTVEVAIDEGIRLDSFPGPLGQVLTNLIQNALVHAFEGRATGTLRITGKRHETRGLRLVVADDGAGMSRATVAHIFDPFFTTKLGKGGSGLGLSICHRIVATVLGGTLTVETEPERGSRFCCTIPLLAPGRV